MKLLLYRCLPDGDRRTSDESWPKPGRSVNLFQVIMHHSCHRKPGIQMKLSSRMPCLGRFCYIHAYRGAFVSDRRTQVVRVRARAWPCRDIGTAMRRLSPERQSARISKITNDGLTRSGTGCFIAVPIWQQWASKIVFNVAYCRHKLSQWIDVLNFSAKSRTKLKAT